MNYERDNSLIECISNYINIESSGALLDCDGIFIVDSDKEICRHNYLRYMYVVQHVFSYKNDFSPIELIYKIKGKHPFLVRTTKQRL